MAMARTSGISDHIVSLPKGGGAVQGLGEKFEPDLHTGTGSYSIPLDIPNGPQNIAPKLSLLYHTGAGNGPFGMGFNLNLLTITRSTNKRIPTYSDDKDPLVMLGAGELIAIDDNDDHYRLRVDTGGGWQIDRDGDGFRITDREGKYFRLGITEQARLSTVENGRLKILSWHLEEIEDSLGNKVSFAWHRESNQLYLERIDYGIYTISFIYEERPDKLTSCRAAFIISTHLRCKAIELRIKENNNNSSTSLIRRWDLAYVQSQHAGHSLLHSVQLTGFDEAGASTRFPILKLGYSTFQPRQLYRFTTEAYEAAPGALPGGRSELIDWDGDGLPDLIEINRGKIKIWRNLGDCTWARPLTLPLLPSPVTLDNPHVTFADMDGNGTADLVLFNRPLAGYYPHRTQGGGRFDRQVFWRNAPSATLTDPDTRMVDLDSDGISDLIVTGTQFFTLYYRDGADGGWQDRHVVPRPQVPPIFLHDKHVHLADMNGDGLQDLVRVDGSGVTYWPYLGDGRWAEAVRLENSAFSGLLPPSRFEPTRLFLSDIDGDGCADMIYIDFDRVLYWINHAGVMLSEPYEISYVPPATPAQVRLADMKGTGTAGVLWSYVSPGSRNTAFFYLDINGSSKPYLLNHIDNGMGHVIDIEYGFSTTESAKDRQNGHQWSTFLPFPVPVVVAMSTTDRPTGRKSTSRFRYHEGHFDGIAREFAGFGIVEVEQEADESTPAMRTVNTYHLGIDPRELDQELPHDQRTRLRALRGKLLTTEIFGLDESPDKARPYQRTENTWTTVVRHVVNGFEIIAPRMTETHTMHFERQPNAYRVTITRTLKEDDLGNILEQEERAEDPRDPSLTRLLHTSTSYCIDETGRFISKPARVTQRDSNGKIVAATISYYDGLPEGNVGTQGLVTRQESLVLTDEIVAQVYSSEAPDFAAVGYHRRPGEDGWWIDQVKYARSDDDNDGLRGTITNGRGYITQIAFDEHKMQPSKVIDVYGNVTKVTYDYYANKIKTLTDPNGVSLINEYDPLGRLTKAMEPGASEAFPSARWIYDTEHVPASIRSEQRAVNGQEKMITRVTYLDGSGQVIEERVITSSGEIVERSQLYTSRGLVSKQFLPFQPNSFGYKVPSDALPHRTLRYDALGRLVEIHNSDGSVRRQVYGQGSVELFDEEDTRSEEGALHANTPTRHLYDATGRIREVAIKMGARSITTIYEYDTKGNLIRTRDAAGGETAFAYDLFGHRLMTSSTISGTTLFVLDPNGNQVERRDAQGQLVRQEFDGLDRLTRVLFPNRDVVAAEYIFHDTGRPAPPAAGAFTRGRAVTAKHEGGEETYSYDALGEVTRKSIRLASLPDHELVFDYTYRADGRRETIVFPSTGGATGRLNVRYEYNERGLLQSIPGFVRSIDYNSAGQRTNIEYTNDIITTYNYDPLSLRLNKLHTVDRTGSVLQSFGYNYDLTGNLIKVNSSTPEQTAQYSYDDLYRLVQASTQSGRNFTYNYDDTGNIIFRSGVGTYQYDANGHLKSAGTDTYTYTSAGQMKSGPMGNAEYDPLGRLLSLTRGPEQMRCTYNHEGHRISMQVTGGATPLEILTPDEMLSIENGVMYGLIFDATARVVQVKLDGMTSNFLHGDHLGSTTLVTGAAGQVLQRITYDPFGDILSNTMATGDASQTRLRYINQEWDDWAGLVYLNTRYYSPHLGCFLTPDMVVPEVYLPQAWNRYSYVQNNPLRFIDPTGHFWEEIGDWFKDNWKYIVAAVAIVAIAVLTVLTAGALGAALGIAAGWIYAGVAAGAVAGGLIGGISAAQAGGDILLGVLTGMAVGGAAGLASFGIKAGVLAFGLKGLVGALVSGTVSGAVSGLSMGFAAGFAGGAGNAGTIWDRMWRGALVGAVVGFAFSFAAYGFQQGWFTGPRIHGPDPNYFRAPAPAPPPAPDPHAVSSLTGASSGGYSEAGKALGQLALGSMTNGNQGFAVFSLFFGESIAPVWQVALTSGSSGTFLLDWADDLWRFLVDKGLVKYQKEGTW